jgi:hypothetical protein
LGFTETVRSVESVLAVAVAPLRSKAFTLPRISARIGVLATVLVTDEDALPAASVAVTASTLVAFSVRETATLCEDPVAEAVTVAAPPVTLMVEPASAVTWSAIDAAVVEAGGVETVGLVGAVESCDTTLVIGADTFPAASVAVKTRVFVASAVSETTTCCPDPVPMAVAVDAPPVTEMDAPTSVVTSMPVEDALVGEVTEETDKAGVTESCTTTLRTAVD